MPRHIIWNTDEPTRWGTIWEDGYQIADILREAGTNAPVFTVYNMNDGIEYVGNSENDALASARSS